MRYPDILDAVARFRRGENVSRALREKTGMRHVAWTPIAADAAATAWEQAFGFPGMARPNLVAADLILGRTPPPPAPMTAMQRIAMATTAMTATMTARRSIHRTCSTWAVSGGASRASAGRS